MFAAAAFLLALAAGPPPAGASGPVTGTVVAMSGGRAQPVPGQTVRTGSHTAVTDADGRFTLSDVPARYDLTIVNRGHSVVTIYQGLTRRDPIVVHAVNMPGGGRHHALIEGKLIGGGPYRSMHVRFSSALASADIILGRFGGGGPRGPDYGPISIDWNGPDALHGEMLALQLGHDPQTPDGGPAWFGRDGDVWLRDHDVLEVDLKLTQLPQVRLPKVAVAMAGDYPLPPAHSHYRSPTGDRLFHGPDFVPWRDSYGPDLGPQGIEYCVEAFIQNPYLRSTDFICQPPRGKDVGLDLRAAPAFRAPASETSAAVGLQLAWSAVPGGVYLLTLGPRKAGGDAPRIQIITPATSAAWPDLDDLGVAFPKPPASYTATVSAEGPFASADDVAGPRGLCAVAPGERWSATSQDLSLPVAPPASPAVVACRAPRGIVCGPSEVYRLEPMNRRIRYLPDFAAAIGISCVDSCDAARAFTKAYAEYTANHPGFDANMPPEPEPPPPPLPPELRRKPTP